MTIVFTAMRSHVIVTACDSAIREEVGGDAAYSRGKKSFVLEGIGVVTAWGAREGNSISRFMQDLRDHGKLRQVDQLADDVDRYLQTEYSPHERGADDTGFDVTGFLDGVPRFYGLSWHAARKEGFPGTYGRVVSSPGPGMYMNYSGREDLAEALVQALTKQESLGQAPPFSLKSPRGLLTLAHLVLRFARELTFDVGPPYVANVISPGNHIHTIHLPEWQPLSDPALMQLVDELRRMEDRWPRSSGQPA